jgi:putative PIN family toxin of toxin-antitoxin system
VVLSRKLCPIFVCQFKGSLHVVVSAHLSSQGAAALILDLAIAQYFRCFASELLLREYEEVLRRARFGLDERTISSFMRRFRKATILIAPRKKLEITSDPDDNKVVECALEARADSVVTGNIRHFPAQFQDVRVIAPRQFLTVLASSPA